MKKLIVGFLAAIACLQFKLNADELVDHFRLLDKNSDGKMSLEEAQTWDWPEAKFRWADTDGDEFITLNEFKSWLPSKKARDHFFHMTENEFRQMDADKDGRISYREECWCTEDAFRSLDKNTDGFLSHAEATRKARSKLRVVRQRSIKLKR